MKADNWLKEIAPGKALPGGLILHHISNQAIDFTFYRKGPVISLRFQEYFFLARHRLNLVENLLDAIDVLLLEIFYFFVFFLTLELIHLAPIKLMNCLHHLISKNNLLIACNCLTPLQGGVTDDCSTGVSSTPVIVVTGLDTGHGSEWVESYLRHNHWRGPDTRHWDHASSDLRPG